jgi:putative thioredoxin
MPSLPNETPAQMGSPFIKEVNIQNFMQEVVQPSLQTPVLVYFTAPWCKPCKQYGPTLEKVVNDAKGRLKLARVDIDQNPQLAQQFRVQSVPMVYIFLQGQPLDGFAGALPESQLKQMLAQFLGASPEQEAAKATLETAAQLLAQNDYEQASEQYQMILGEDETNVEALTGLARCFIGQGMLAEAEEVLSTVLPESQKHESYAAAQAALSLAKSLPAGSDEASLRKTLESSADNAQARYDLACILFVTGKQEEAIGELLKIIAKNKDWNEGAARVKLLTFFEALGHTHPLTMQGRRKLSSILF